MAAPNHPEAFRHQYRLLTADARRMVFVLPRWHLAVVAASAAALGGFLLLNPELFDKPPALMTQLAGWGSVLMGVALGYFVATRRGRLLLDRDRRTAYLEYVAPKSHTRWMQPFEAFEAIHTRQVKDMHGLHNHWAIELVDRDGTALRVGYGLWGAVRKRSRDRLTGQLSRLLGVPVVKG